MQNDVTYCRADRPVVFFAALFGTHHFEPPVTQRQKRSIFDSPCRGLLVLCSTVNLVTSRFVGRPRLAQDIDMDLQPEPCQLRSDNLNLTEQLESLKWPCMAAHDV